MHFDVFASRPRTAFLATRVVAVLLLMCAFAGPPPAAAQSGSPPSDSVSITPATLQAALPAGQRAVQTLTLRNEGDRYVRWSIADSTSSVAVSPSLSAARGLAASRDRSDTVGVQEELWRAVQDDGQVPVIVELAVRTELEKSLGTGAIQQQRQRIAAAQASVVAALDGRATSVWRSAYVPVLTATVDAEGLRRLQDAPAVRRVVRDVAEPPHLMESIALVGAPAVHQSGYRGEGQAVAILDSGVDARHSFLGDRVVEEACFSTTRPASGVQSLCPSGDDMQAGEGAACDVSTVLRGGCGHGTHVAGIAAGQGSGRTGMAPEADIIAVQVFSRFTESESCGGNPPCVRAYQSDLIQALEYVYDLRAAHDIAAVNMSLGGGRYDAYCNDDPRAPIIDQLRAAGTATVTSAGNDGYTSALGAPACIASVIAVGSTHDGSANRAADAVSSFSNSSFMLDFWAPGQRIESSVPLGFGVKSGTSMAAPHVAGAWALLQSKWPDASVGEIQARLSHAGVPVVDPRNGEVRPRIQVDAALESRDWAIVGPVAGTLPPRATQEITVVFDTGTQEAGTYERVLPLHIGETSRDVRLSLDVVDQDRAQAAVRPSSLQASVRTGDRILLEQQITNTVRPGGQALVVTPSLPPFLEWNGVSGEGVRRDEARVVIDPQATATLTYAVQQEAETTTTLQGAVTLRTNDPRADRISVPTTVVIRVPQLAVVDRELDFGAVAAGAMAERTVEIENTGDALLNGEVRFGDNPGPFALAEGARTYRLNAGETLPLTIVSRPDEASIYRGTLEVHHDAPNRESPIIIPLEVAPNELVLRPNYPNPFQDATTIEYGIPRTTGVRIDVFNVLGQRVATLAQGEHEPGAHRVQWDGRSQGAALASGVYFVRLQTGTGTRVDRLTVVR